MNALSARNDYSSGVRDAVSVDAPDATDHALGLQLCRAGILSMTRLQLALERGDRRRAMEAIDRLHTFDSEVEQLVDRLSGPATDARMKAIARHLSEEKMELAFEKLALASGVSGPGLVSRTPFPADLPQDAERADHAGTFFAAPRGGAGGAIRTYALCAAALIAAIGGVTAILVVML